MKKTLIPLLFCLCIMACSTNKHEITVEGVQQYKMGELDFFAIEDAESSMPAKLFVNADSAELTKLIPSGAAEASTNVFLLKKEDKNILFDAGNGGNRGKLLVKLNEMGLSNEDIDAVLITHFHADHIGGLFNEGEPVFTKAEIYVSQVEFDAWTNVEPTNDYAKWVSEMAMQLATYYGEKFHLFQFEDTILDNIVAHSAVGHTPGHTVFEMDNLLVVGDLIHAAAIQLVDPNICAQYDTDFEKAVATRLQYFNYAAQNKKTVASMHMPFPGVVEDFSTVWKEKLY